MDVVNLDTSDNTYWNNYIDNVTGKNKTGIKVTKSNNKVSTNIFFCCFNVKWNNISNNTYTGNAGLCIDVAGNFLSNNIINNNFTDLQLQSMSLIIILSYVILVI